MITKEKKQQIINEYARTAGFTFFDDNSLLLNPLECGGEQNKSKSIFDDFKEKIQNFLNEDGVYNINEDCRKGIDFFRRSSEKNL